MQKMPKIFYSLSEALYINNHNLPYVIHSQPSTQPPTNLALPCQQIKQHDSACPLNSSASPLSHSPSKSALLTEWLLRTTLFISIYLILTATQSASFSPCSDTSYTQYALSPRVDPSSPTCYPCLLPSIHHTLQKKQQNGAENVARVSVFNSVSLRQPSHPTRGHPSVHRCHTLKRFWRLLQK